MDGAAQLEGKPSILNQESAVANTQSLTSSQTLSGTTDLQFKVSGNCDMCKDRIETAAKSVSGVSSANWRSETKMLHVQFDTNKTNKDIIQKAIAKVGHDTENFKAPEDVYKELPECCLYRKK